MVKPKKPEVGVYSPAGAKTHACLFLNGMFLCIFKKAPTDAQGEAFARAVTAFDEEQEVGLFEDAFFKSNGYMPSRNRDCTDSSSIEYDSPYVNGAWLGWKLSAASRIAK